MTHGVEVNQTLVGLDLVGDLLQHLALPFARPVEVLQRRTLDAPRERKLHER